MHFFISRRGRRAYGVIHAKISSIFVHDSNYVTVYMDVTNYEYVLILSKKLQRKQQKKTQGYFQLAFLSYF